MLHREGIVSRKKKRPQIPGTPPKFAAGTAVRVRPGAVHPHYPDIPMGGWTGEIVEVSATAAPPAYEIEWSEETLQRAHPILEWRCERDDRSFGTTWLREPVLEPDPAPSAEAVLEQPTELRPRPLDPTDPDDRVRAAFGLTSDDDLPTVTEENLRVYHEQLTQLVRFPVPGIRLQSDSRGRPIPEPVMMDALAPIEHATTDEGLFVAVTGERGGRTTIPLITIQSLPLDRASHDEIEAYSSWFIDQLEEPSPQPKLRNALLSFGLVWIMVGMVIGASLATRDQTLLAIQIGAGLGGLAGAMVGVVFEQQYRRSGNLRPRKIGGLFFGALLFGSVGAAAGCALLGWLGALPGGIAGWVAPRVLRLPKLDELKLAMFGAALGSVGQAFYLDPAKAGWGSACGLLAGVGALVVFFVTVSLYAMVSMRSLETK